MADTLPPPAAPTQPVKPAPVRAVDDWAARKGTSTLWLRAACAGQGWNEPGSVVIDEAAYDAAIRAAQTVECR